MTKYIVLVNFSYKRRKWFCRKERNWIITDLSEAVFRELLSFQMYTQFRGQIEEKIGIKKFYQLEINSCEILETITISETKKEFGGNNYNLLNFI